MIVNRCSRLSVSTLGMLMHRGEITKEAYLYNSFVKQKFLLDYARQMHVWTYIVVILMVLTPRKE